MNKKYTFFRCLIVSFLMTSCIMFSENDTIEPIQIIINFDKKPLAHFINHLASLSKKNIIFPFGADALKTTVTVKLDQSLSLDDAWIFAYSLLEQAGYTFIEKDNYSQIVKVTKDIHRQGLHIFVETPLEQMPDSDERALYMLYLENIKMSKESGTELKNLMQKMLPENAFNLADESTNAIIIGAKTREIKTIVEIIKKLDQSQFQEKMEFINLHYSSAQAVATLFAQEILKDDQQSSRYRPNLHKKTDVSYFSKNLRVVAETKQNALIVVGQTQAINRLKKFIDLYIDVPPQQGKSILHTYQLQYLNAEEFAPTLERIVSSTREGGTGQATGGKKEGSTQRSFDEVIVAIDKPTQQAQQEEGSKTKIEYFGGNRLIIACNTKDWKQIKTIIEELDIPQPQVLLEVLIADLTIDDSRALGSQFRNPQKIPILNKFEVQSAQLAPGVIVDNNDNPLSVAGDMLRNAFDGNGDAIAEGGGLTNSLANFMQPGSSVISLSDNNGQVWSVIQILKLFSHSKILSHPHVVATNNREALVQIGQERLVEGNVSNAYGGSTVQNREYIHADLEVRITPKITAEDSVNLSIKITINEFIPSAGDTNARANREIKTNAIIRDGELLTLGGLTQTTAQNVANHTPGIEKVPLLGWFFKRNSKNVRKNNLTIFISPTIIRPRLRGGIGKYTNDYIEMNRHFAKDSSLFDGLKDPITRWFFTTSQDSIEEAVDDFTERYTLGGISNALDSGPAPMPKKKSKKQKLIVAENMIQQQQPFSFKALPEKKTHQEEDKLKQLVAQNNTNPFEKKDKKRL